MFLLNFTTKGFFFSFSEFTARNVKDNTLTDSEERNKFNQKYQWAF